MTTRSTLRLPAPPLPPKPLHLTTRREGARRSYPAMPRWSRSASDAGGAVEGPSAPSEEQEREEDDEEEDQWWGARSRIGSRISRSPAEATMAQLVAQEEEEHPPAAEFGATACPTTDLDSDPEGATLKQRPSLARLSTVKALRRSIFFDSSLPNPLLSKEQPPSTDADASLLDLPDQSLPALSLHSFSGETDFGELSFAGGVSIDIEIEDLGGGWSLGCIDGTRGLIPRGWYAYVEDSERVSPTELPPEAPIFNEPGPSSPRSPPPSPPIESTSTPQLRPISAGPAYSKALEIPLPPSPTDSWVTELDTPPSATSSVRGRGRSTIGKKVVVSGVEFEPTDFVENPSYEQIAPSSDAPPRESTSPTKEEIARFFEGFADAPETNAPLESPVLIDAVPTVLAPSGTPRASLVDEQLRSSRYVDSLYPARTELSTLPAPSPASARLASLIRPTPVTSEPPPTRSLTLPRLFTLGIAGPLGRSFSISSIGLRRDSARMVGGSTRGGVIGLVEDWILRDAVLEGAAGAESEEFHIETGPTWRPPLSTLSIAVHSPAIQRDSTTSQYTVYQLSTTIHSAGELSPTTISVDRRYSHFTLLHALLSARYPVLCLPRLPPKAYAGRFNADFIEERRNDLERWCARVARHPVLGSSEELRGFLSVGEDADLHRLLLPTSMSDKFLGQVFHPDFNVDIAEAEETGQKFEGYFVGGSGMRELETAVAGVRDAGRVFSSGSRQFAHSLVRLVNQVTGDTPAWTWKEESGEVLSLSKGMLATASAIENIAIARDESGQSEMLSLHETTRELASPLTSYAPLLELHRFAIEKHGLTADAPQDRCETVLNVTAAEMERVHEELAQDLRDVTTRFLDSEISTHQHALRELTFARSHFEESSFAALALSGPVDRAGRRSAAAAGWSEASWIARVVQG